MLKVKNLTLVENAWKEHELSKLSGKAELKVQNNSIATGAFHMSNRDTCVILVASANVKKVTLAHPSHLTVTLTADVTREFVVTQGQTTIDTGFMGVTSATVNGTDIVQGSINNGVITLKTAAVPAQDGFMEVVMNVNVATGIAVAPECSHQITITSDNEPGLLYFNLLSNVNDPANISKNELRCEVRGINSKNIVTFEPVVANESGTSSVTPVVSDEEDPEET